MAGMSKTAGASASAATTKGAEAVGTAYGGPVAGQAAGKIAKPIADKVGAAVEKVASKFEGKAGKDNKKEEKEEKENKDIGDEQVESMKKIRELAIELGKALMALMKGPDTASPASGVQNKLSEGVPGEGDTTDAPDMDSPELGSDLSSAPAPMDIGPS